MEKTIEVLLSVCSESASVLSLPDQLPGIVYYRLAKGETAFGNKKETMNSVGIMLPLSADCDVLAMNDAENWMQEHRETIAAIYGAITIQFRTFVNPNFDGQSIKLPASIVRMCAELNINIVICSDKV